MAFYPILMDLEGRRVLVVGGGRVAERKVRSLLEFGACVDVVSRALSPALEDLQGEGRVRWAAREFQEAQLEGMTLVVAATDDSETNRGVSASARKQGIPVNAVDQPEDCTFIVPAVVRRGDLVLAVSTSGRSPALAKRIREDLQAQYGPEYSAFLNLMRWVRRNVLERGRAQEENRRTFHAIVHSRLLDTLRLQDWTSAAAILTQILGTPWSPEEVAGAIEGGASYPEQG